MVRGIRDESDDKTNFEFAGTFTMYSFISLVILQSLICLISKNKGNSSFAIWYNISYLQIIQWVNFIKIDPDSEFEAFFKQLSIIFRPIKMEYGCYDQAFNTFGLETVQIHSNGIINNAQGVLIIYAGVLFVFFCIITVKIYNKSKFLTGLIKVIQYSMIIRLHLLFFLDLMIYSIINIRFYSGDGNCSYINLCISIIFMIVSGVFLILIPLFIKNIIRTSKNSNFSVISQPLETLFSEFTQSSSLMNFQYYTIYLVHRVTLSFTLINFQNVHYLQLFVMITFQITISNSYLVYYIYRVNPYKYQSDTKTTIISESLTLLLFIIFWIRTLDLNSNTNYYITTFCALLIWITEICNILKFVFALRRTRYLNERTVILPQITKIQDASDSNESKNKNNGWIGELNNRFKGVRRKGAKKISFSQLNINQINGNDVIDSKNDFGLHSKTSVSKGK